VVPVTADDWFFAGHFKNDPCMPGTLMFEGCLQAMAFYLAACGFSVDRDGWRFEPVPDIGYQLRCRGQVTPQSRELVYELFVEELHDGPEPTLYADLLCTVDGLKAFHCRRMGLRLVPGWPLESRPELLHERHDSRAVVDERALLACAWGRPTDAFGPRYQQFDGVRRLPRLPGPPYHFMTRVTRLEADVGEARPGALVEVEYDIPSDAWYFTENGSATMPFCVLLEAALQPCGRGGPVLPQPGRHGSAAPRAGPERRQAAHAREADERLALGRDVDPGFRGELRSRRRVDLRADDGVRLLPRRRARQPDRAAHQR
jgi:3-hydroxymyristoyl/3-hydroxydecanoyl-(acyl carrier protein) dehydratase